MSENVRGLIADEVLMYACGKMSGCFTLITCITARAYKFINHTRTKPTRDRIFHAKHATYLEGGKNQFDTQIIAIAFDKVTNLFLSDNGKMAYIG